MKDDEKYLKGELALSETLTYVFGLVTPLTLGVGTVYGIENGLEILKPTHGEAAYLLRILYAPYVVGGAYITGFVDEHISTPLAERTAKRICKLVLG